MMNYVVIMGRLTANSELRQTSDGIPYCNVTVAVERDYRKDAETKVDFIPVTSWRSTAEFISRNFVKGQMIAVHGSLRINTYEKDGEKRYITSVNADKLFSPEELKAGQLRKFRRRAAAKLKALIYPNMKKSSLTRTFRSECVTVTHIF